MRCPSETSRTDRMQVLPTVEAGRGRHAARRRLPGGGLAWAIAAGAAAAIVCGAATGLFVV